jgi:transcriptional regulator with XRE-family HTH domain
MSKQPTNRALRHEVAVRLREAILKNGLNVPQAAKLLGISRQALWLYLHEKSMPGGSVLERACRLWNLSLNVNGFHFTKESFGPQKKTQFKSEQLNLFRVLDRIRPDQIEAKLVGRVGRFYELRVRIKVAS